MQYMVVGADGNEYGPATIDTLKAWAAENRLAPGTQVRDCQTNQVIMASAVPGVFAAQSAPNVPPPMAGFSTPPPPMSGYNRPMQGSYSIGDDGKREFSRAMMRCGLAVVFFLLFPWAGIISAVYALIYAVQARSKGHQYGNLAIGIAVGVVLLVIAGNYFGFAGLIDPASSRRP